jgi:hypothetical protein
LSPSLGVHSTCVRFWRVARTSPAVGGPPRPFSFASQATPETAQRHGLAASITDREESVSNAFWPRAPCGKGCNRRVSACELAHEWRRVRRVCPHLAARAWDVASAVRARCDTPGVRQGKQGKEHFYHFMSCSMHLSLQLDRCMPGNL